MAEPDLKALCLEALVRKLCALPGATVLRRARSAGRFTHFGNGRSGRAPVDLDAVEAPSPRACSLCISCACGSARRREGVARLEPEGRIDGT
ncbi:hypothetical protein [Streptomyces sp. NBC_00859]|uniref:hypothetical protein n=1 Tax=Streptomyces sp. NBC_00859 TaxID=2903682 RepID=UPI003864B349|nr:hypothetical protein OG584_04535 [Streptomyces sp. NBC_00859]